MRARRCLSIGLALIAVVSMHARADTRSSLTATALVYPNDPLLVDQDPAHLHGELLGKISGDYRLSVNLALELDARALASTNAEDKFFADAKQAALSAERGDWNLKLGMLDQYWGYLNAQNIVDLFNQRDLVSDFRGYVHLGQPGISLDHFGDTFETTLLYAPYSRERRLSVRADRYRIAAEKFTDGRFEGGQWRTNAAARILYRGDETEIALSHFYGHSREPEFRLITNFSGRPSALQPFYARIQQTGLEWQRVAGEYLVRGEGFYRSGQSGGGFSAAAAGVERIFYGVFNSKADLLGYAEYYWDDRGPTAPRTSFDNDLTVGGNLRLNDAASNRFDARLVVDLTTESVLIDLAYQRRVAEHHTLRFAISAPLNTSGDIALANFEKDEYFRMSIERHF